MEIKDLTLEQLKKDRPDLVTALQESADRMSADIVSAERGHELQTLREELAALKAEKAARELQEAIAGELHAAGLDPANKTHCSQVFLEDLTATADAARRKAKIDDRKALVGPLGAVSTRSPLQESRDTAVPPAMATLAERIRRFAK